VRGLGSDVHDDLIHVIDVAQGPGQGHVSRPRHQLLSKEVQRGVADEILHRAREEIMAREARQARD